MPLFHIHGLIAVLATSMSQGASVCCSSGFNALKFLELAKEEKSHGIRVYPPCTKPSYSERRSNQKLLGL